MKRESKIERVMVYFQSYHTISGSDWNEEFAQKTMKYCEDRIYKLSGLEVGDIPANYHDACSFLNQPFQNN